MKSIVIFDFDDTLTDNNVLDYQAFCIPAKRLGLPQPTLKKICRLRKDGLLAKEIVKIMIKDNPQLVKKFLSIRYEFLNSVASNKFLKLKKNTKILLHALNQRKIKCIICSAKRNKRIIMKFLAYNEIRHYFAKIYFMGDINLYVNNLISSNRIKIKKKLINRIIENEGKRDKQIIYVGNSLEDFKAIQKRKIKFILYQNTYIKEFVNYKVVKVNNMKKLKNLIEKYVEKLEVEN